MTTFTVPANLRSVFEGTEPLCVVDEAGNVLGTYTPRIPTPLREATDEDYEWAFKNITKEQIEASERSGPGRPASEIIPELIRKYGL